jgi:hypothetical protein
MLNDSKIMTKTSVGSEMICVTMKKNKVVPRKLAPEFMHVSQAVLNVRLTQVVKESHSRLGITDSPASEGDHVDTRMIVGMLALSFVDQPSRSTRN